MGCKEKPETAQQSIPYRQMCKDGTCRVNDRLYTKTIVFQDINYQLAQNDDKTMIFEGYCDFLNYFDSSIKIQLTFINQFANVKEFQQSIDIPDRPDKYNSIRREYADMLKTQLAKGNNGLVKTKYITFGIEADNLKTAKMRLERIEADILNNFKVLGVKALTLNGIERLAVLHGQFHPDGNEKLHFDWNDIPISGLSTKDYIAPASFDFGDKRSFRMSGTIGAVSFVQVLATELSDRMLADFLDMDGAVTVNLHIKSIDQTEAIKNIKRTLMELDGMKIEQQKKAFTGGYDIDIISSDISTYGDATKELLTDLQSRNERMYLVTALVMNTAKTRQKLETGILAAQGITQKYNCALKRLEDQQEKGLMSSLPLGLNHVEIQRGLTTSSTAIFVPFTTQELFMRGEALYYGLNALSNNLIMADRKRLKNPNGLFLGTPGSGKSFAAKREIVNVFLLTNDDIIISDPESEYAPLVLRLGGQVIKLSPASGHYINPMDINPDYSEDDDPVSLKSDFLLSLCELIVGAKDGLNGFERSVIDRAVKNVYREYLAAPHPDKMPILEDLYNELRRFEEPEAQRVATALELYVHGSLNVFNHRTNVNLQNRLVCFDIKELGKSLKKIGMLILQDQVWGRVTANRAKNESINITGEAHESAYVTPAPKKTPKSTWFYQDEFHLMLKEEQTAAYSVEIFKRFRKWGGIPTALTQNVKDLLASREVENIFENSDFIVMLNQAAGDRLILSKQLGISTHQLSYVTHANAGEGLLFYGNTIIPFVDRFPKDTELYRIMTTKPDEVSSA